MIILTCANKDIAKDDDGKIHKGFSFKNVITETVKSACKFDYTPIVYDLGSLGIGEKYYVGDASFQSKGYYEKEVISGYKSKSLFKPEIVKLCMSKYNELVVYLDGDAQLVGRIDEVDSKDYDVGVTLRSPFELETEWHKEHIEIVRYINAGVIFFQPTKAAARFVDLWQSLTMEIGNDQMALNRMTCPDVYPEKDSIVTINGVRIKYFSCLKYNYYYFKEVFSPNIKIMHFKGPVRCYFPFDWKKKLYCLIIIPFLNFIKKIIKKNFIRS